MSVRRCFTPVIPWLVAGWMMTACWATQIAPAADKPAEKAPSRKASDLLAQQQKIERTLQSIQESPLPHQLIDPADVVKQVGKDPGKLCEYVRSHLAFEPYRGFLKGPVGALSSRRANSGDRSLLLAVLLQAAGIKAKLVKGTIAADKAPAAAMPQALKPIDRPAVMAALKSYGLDTDELDRTLRAAQIDKEKSLEELTQRVARDVQTLAAVLDESETPAPWAAAEPLTEHWWVRTDAGDLDPTLASSGAKETGAWELKDIPAVEFHTISFREVIVVNNKPQTVLEEKHRAADLFGKTVTFANMAMDWGQGAGKKGPLSVQSLTAFKDNRRFLPTLTVEDKTSPGKAFDIDGKLLTDDSGKAGGAKGIGGGLGGLFGGGDEGVPQSKLNECRLEVVIAAPAERSPLVVKRWLMRPQASAAQKVFDLCTSYQFLALPEDVCEALIARKSAQSFEKLGPWLKGCGDKDVLTDQGHRKIGRLNGELWGFALGRRNELRRLGEMCPGTVFVHNRPTLAASFSRLVDDKARKAALGIDIFCNQMQTVGPKPQGWSDHPGLIMGAMDTVLEQLSMEHPGLANQNASMLLDKARQSGLKPVLVKGDGSGKVNAQGLSEAVMRQMSADANGAVFVSIPGKVGAWYRVDLATGISLGYVENGGGQALTEHIEDSALVWMVYEYIKIYVEAVRCLGLGFAMAISMDPEGQRTEFAVCTCEVALEIVTSLACIAREADPETLLDFGKFGAVSYGWGKFVGKICEKAFEGGEGHEKGGE